MAPPCGMTSGLEWEIQLWVGTASQHRISKSRTVVFLEVSAFTISLKLAMPSHAVRTWMRLSSLGTKRGTSTRTFPSGLVTR